MVRGRYGAWLLMVTAMESGARHGSERVPRLSLATIGIGLFMTALDAGSVNFALRAIRDDLHIPMAQVHWIVSGYFMTVAIVCQLFGRLGDVLGRARVFTAALGLFAGASGLCALSTSFPMLLLGRVLAAIAGGAVLALMPAITTELTPRRFIGRAFGAIQGMAQAGSLLGAPIGGAILSYGSWRWIFSVNVPIGLATMALAFRTIPAGRGVRKPLDSPGVVLLGVSIFSLLLALNRSDTRLVLAAVVGLVLLVLWERRANSPILNLDSFRNRGVSLGLANILIGCIPLFAYYPLFPFYLANGRGLTVEVIVPLLALAALANVAGTLVAGWASDRISPSTVAVCGFLANTLGFYTLSFAGPTDSIVSIGARVALIAFGTGGPPATRIVMSSLTMPQLGQGSATLTTARQLGMALGTTLGAALLTARTGGDTSAGATVAGFSFVLRVCAAMALFNAILAGLNRPRAARR